MKPEKKMEKLFFALSEAKVGQRPGPGRGPGHKARNQNLVSKMRTSHMYYIPTSILYIIYIYIYIYIYM